MSLIRLLSLLCGIVFLTFRPANNLWADSIYTWTDQSGVVHFTETPPPPGVGVDSEMNNPPSAPPPSRQNGPPRFQSIGNREVLEAELRVRQAEQRLQAAEKNAYQADLEAQATMQKSRQYIETHNNNQYMRRVFKFQLKQAESAARESEVKAQEAADQLKQAEQYADAAQQQLAEAQEDANIFSQINR